MEKVLILGASGLVGKALIHECKDWFDLYGTYSTTATMLPEDKQFHLEIQQIDKMKEMMASIQPDIVISCLRGEFNQQLEFHKELAMELRNSHARIYFFSTANVFDGDFSKHHTETDTPVSVSDYGKYKINGENMLKQILKDRAMIIRIPAIWGKDSLRMNLLKDSMKESRPIDVFSNLECNNLLDTQLAKQLRYIIDNQLKGTFHLGSVDMMAQGEFYNRLVNKLSSETNLLRYQLLNDSENTFYWGLTSSRDDIPASLKSTNESIISYLLE